MNAKTAGQTAYEADCAARPLYCDGTARRTWADLDDIARLSWERNPTPRWSGSGERMPFNIEPMYPA